MTSKKATRKPAASKPQRVVRDGSARGSRTAKAPKPEVGTIMEPLDPLLRFILPNALDRLLLKLDRAYADTLSRLQTARVAGDRFAERRLLARVKAEQFNRRHLREQARMIVNLVNWELVEGSGGHVGAMHRQLKSRLRREWLTRCRLSKAWWAELQEQGLSGPKALRSLQRQLLRSLVGVDIAARTLTIEDVQDGWKLLDAEQLAGHLAFKCGAFEYQSFRPAWNAFRNLSKE
jgi:hypothetical protein